MVKRYKKKDPQAKRERRNYAHPVASRELIIQYMQDQDSPVTFKQFLVAFGALSEEEVEGLRRRVRAMERDGQLMRNRRGSYALVNKMDLIAGRVVAVRDGYGFLVCDKGGDDIYIPEGDMRGLFTDDRVLVRLDYSKRRRAEGRVVEVLERNTQQVVGRLHHEKGALFVSPDSKVISQDVLIASDMQGDAQAGDFVVVEIIDQPTRRRLPTGKIIQILGDQLAPGLEIELALRSYRLPHEWSSELIQEVEEISPEIGEDELQGREDLRQLPFVTIDGQDARDFDDAVYCESMGKKGWVLYVAIADVAHYVEQGSALDCEAENRGNSVYFSSRVIPMLPEVLSNGLCSLKPNEDRLCMVCEMQVSSDGLLKSSKQYNAVIHSHARLTYSGVAKALSPKAKQPHPRQKELDTLYDLYKVLVKQRKLRGALEFDRVETRIIFDKQGRISHIVPVERNEAHRLIEECMLLANVSVSHALEKTKIPTLYRIHEAPDPERLTDLRDFLKAFGLRLTGGKKPTSQDYTKLMQRIATRDDSHLIQTVMLRSLKQAIYLPENSGHFGLSYEGYTHFTSPIRRYPDLMVHRALKHVIAKRKVKSFSYTLEEMQTIAQHCSMTERRADRAVRDSVDWLKCEFMQDKLGNSYEGIVVEVTGFGVFIELKQIYVQGLLHITALKNDYYIHDSTHHLLRGRASGVTYRLGDTVTVQVDRVDLDERKIDFSLAK